MARLFCIFASRNEKQITMDAKTNIFFHAPKELTTDAFLVWLLYFLDSEEAYKTQKQAFFDSIILKKADRGRPIGGIELKRQENNVDVLLTFRFEDKAEQQMVLFENKDLEHAP